jgi:hypothetical protein
MAAIYLARCKDESRAYDRRVPDAISALDAAVLFAERWEGTGLTHVVVTEVETGAEQCFEIDLGSELAKPCED